MGFLSDFDGVPSIPDATSGQAFDLETIGEETSLVDAMNEFVISEICEVCIPII